MTSGNFTCLKSINGALICLFFAGESVKKVFCLLAVLIKLFLANLMFVVISKVFESVLLLLYDDFLTSDSLQFGFKKNSSCTCTHVLFTANESVKYFTTRGSKVYCASLDATKAFDKVLHNGLYMKLLQRGAPVTFIRLLQ